MNVQKESTGELTALLTIEIEQADYVDQVKNTLKDYQRKIDLPGFRQGKVPFGIVKKKYGTSILVDELNKVLAQNIDSYIKDNEVKILGEPLPNTEKQGELDFENDTNFTFFFDLGLQPEFELAINKRMTLEQMEIEVEDKQVDEEIERMRKQKGTFESVEVAEEEDMIYGKSYLEGEEESRVEEERVIYKNAFLDESDWKEFIGAKVGKRIKIDPVKQLARKDDLNYYLGVEKDAVDDFTTPFEFEITKINHMIPAELNEELFNSVFQGAGISTEEDFRARLVEDMSRQFISESNRVFIEKAKQKLIKKADMSLPDEFMKRWIKTQDREQKITDEIIEKEYVTYADNIRWQLIENRIILDNDLAVKPEDVETFIAKAVNFPNETDEEKEQLKRVVDSIMENEDERKRVYDQLYDEKLQNFLKENTKLNLKKVSLEEFYNLAVSNN